MNKIFFIITILLMATIFPGEGIAGFFVISRPGDNEVAIGRGCIEIPLNSILLLRKDSKYCALKFTRNWTEIDEEGKKRIEPYVARGIMDTELAKEAYEKKYSTYEVYYQGDGSADFSRSNVVKSENIASLLPMKGPFRPFMYQPGNPHVKCGPFKMVWQYKNCVSFIPSGKGLGDFGFELAPTPWTDIKDVNIKDTRVKWYRYDEKREKVLIPIDKLWDDTGKKEEGKGKKSDSGLLNK